MTLLRRQNNDGLSRADAVRARRKQRDSQRRAPIARTTTELRSAVQRAPAPMVTRRRLPPTPARAKTRWNAAVPRGGALGALALPLPKLNFSWRYASLAVVMMLVSLLVYTHTSSQFYISAINLAGARFVPGEEIYQASGINYMHIFWIDPEAIAENIRAVPGIKSAQVVVQWPNNVYVEVVENEPVLAWSQGGQTMWVDRDGVAFPARGDLAGLLPIVVDDATFPLNEESRIPVEAIAGALQLKSLRSNIELLHYDSVYGLSYQDGRNWRGYFGVGTDMEVKLAVYETLVDSLLSRGIHPSMISVVDKDAPYYRR